MNEVVLSEDYNKAVSLTRRICANAQAGSGFSVRGLQGTEGDARQQALQRAWVSELLGNTVRMKSVSVAGRHRSMP